MPSAKIAAFPTKSRIRLREQAFQCLVLCLDDAETEYFFLGDSPRFDALVQLARGICALRINAPSHDVALLTWEQTEKALRHIEKLRMGMLCRLADGADRSWIESGTAALEGLTQMWAGSVRYPRNSTYAAVLHDAALAFEFSIMARAVNARMLSHIAQLQREFGLVGQSPSNSNPEA